MVRGYVLFGKERVRMTKQQVSYNRGTFNYVVFKSRPGRSEASYGFAHSLNRAPFRVS